VTRGYGDIKEGVTRRGDPSFSQQGVTVSRAQPLRGTPFDMGNVDGVGSGV
jgi:hypothetical protein